MAEVFGIVAGGVALAQVAAKIGSHTIALKQLWGETEDVPHMIRSLMDEICLFEPLIRELEISFNTPRSEAIAWDDSVVKQIVTCCRKALEDLTTLVDELTSELGCKNRIKRGKAKVKVYLKKDFWDKQEIRLCKVVQMLMLAQQCYLL